MNSILYHNNLDSSMRNNMKIHNFIILKIKLEIIINFGLKNFVSANAGRDKYMYTPIL